MCRTLLSAKFLMRNFPYQFCLIRRYTYQVWDDPDSFSIQWTWWKLLNRILFCFVGSANEAWSSVLSHHINASDEGSAVTRNLELVKNVTCSIGLSSLRKCPLASTMRSEDNLRKMWSSLQKRNRVMCIVSKMPLHSNLSQLKNTWPHSAGVHYKMEITFCSGGLHKGMYGWMAFHDNLTKSFGQHSNWFYKATLSTSCTEKEMTWQLHSFLMRPEFGSQLYLKSVLQPGRETVFVETWNQNRIKKTHQGLVYCYFKGGFYLKIILG